MPHAEPHTPPRGERRGTAAAGGCGCAVVAALILWLQVLGVGSVIQRAGLDIGLVLTMSLYFTLIAVYITIVAGIVGAFWSAGFVRRRSNTLRIGIAFISVIPLSALLVAATAFTLCVLHNTQIGGWRTFTSLEPVAFQDCLALILARLIDNVDAVAHHTLGLSMPSVDVLAVPEGLDFVDSRLVGAFVAAAHFVIAFALLAPPAYAVKRLLGGVVRLILGKKRPA